MRKKNLTNLSVEAALSTILAPLFRKYPDFSIRQETAASYGMLSDHLCGRKQPRGGDCVFLLSAIGAESPLLVRSDGCLHLPKWLAKAAFIDADTIHACLPREKDLADFVQLFLPQIEAKILELAKRRKDDERMHRTVESLSQIVGTGFANGLGSAYISVDGGGSITIGARTLGTVQLRIDLTHITVEDAGDLLSLVGPFITANCDSVPHSL